VIDRQDEALADTVRALGLEVVVTDTIMTDGASRATLAREMVAAAVGKAAARATTGVRP